MTRAEAAVPGGAGAGVGVGGGEAALPRLTVIGTGYLGATHAICMATLGYQVLGLDADAGKIARLAAGEVPFFEPGLPELLNKALESGRLRFSTSYAEAAGFGDVHFLCVGTPQQPGSDAADLRHLDSAASRLAVELRRPALVVGKSTVPVGTAARLAGMLAELAPAGPAVQLAWNPEFLREGRAVDDTVRPNRLVFGVSSDWARQRLAAAFAPQLQAGTPVVVTDLATAELVKVAANSFLATKISYINAMAEVCEAAGADVAQLATALGYDDRIGGAFLQPGLGFGGGCLPKDIRAFRHRATEIGAGPALAFLHEIDTINTRRRTRLVDLAAELAADPAAGVRSGSAAGAAGAAGSAGAGPACSAAGAVGAAGDLAGVRIAALGAAFKPDSDDIRDSPALAVATALAARGAAVTVTDPAAVANARAAHPHLSYADGAVEAATGADLVLLLTEWTEFREIAPEALAAVVRRRQIVDGRQALDADRWRAAGWVYRAPGRP